MKGIYLLDCTLRDGGYANNWEFGEECAREFPHELADSNIDMIELGFIRNEESNAGRTVFTSVEDFKRIERRSKDKSVIYSAMIEGSEKAGTYPVDRLGTPDQTGIDLIRVCTWKRLMEEHMEYCGRVGEQGYMVSIQPTAIDQYNDEEFIALLQLANRIHPFAFYLVDTWGTQSAGEICHYALIADKYLHPETKIGYHGHNNKMQAIGCVDALLGLGLNREICIDASVMGMGRGPGNLQTEVAMEYLNHKYGKNYKIENVIGLYSKYIKDFYEKSPWGYSVYHFLSSARVLPQDFATYFKEKQYSVEAFVKFTDSLTAEEKVVFRKDFVESRLDALGLKHSESI